MSKKREADTLVSEERFIEVESGNARIRVTDNTPMELLRKVLMVTANA